MSGTKRGRALRQECYGRELAHVGLRRNDYDAGNNVLRAALPRRRCTGRPSVRNRVLALLPTVGMQQVSGAAWPVGGRPTGNGISWGWSPTRASLPYWGG